MNLIQKHERCIGLSFPAIGKYKIEIWFCPPHYVIKPHSHNNVDIELTILFSHNVRIHRQRKGEPIRTFHSRIRNMFKTFTVSAGDIHWFSVSSLPFIFINRERWHCKPTSASVDFQLVEQKQLISK